MWTSPMEEHSAEALQQYHAAPKSVIPLMTPAPTTNAGQLPTGRNHQQLQNQLQLPNLPNHQPQSQLQGQQQNPNPFQNQPNFNLHATPNLQAAPNYRPNTGGEKPPHRTPLAGNNCHNFNINRPCGRTPCLYPHVCSNCAGDHRAQQCPLPNRAPLG